MKNTIEKFEKTANWLKEEFRSIHTGKASPVVLDIIDVDSYGTMQPIKNVASISVMDARTLLIEPWDKNVVKAIEKAIAASNLGLSAVVDGTKIRVMFPMLTTENREKLVKVLKEKLEEARITIRKDREAAQKDIEALEKEGDITEDDKFRSKTELQKQVDKYNSLLEEIFTHKEKEIMTV